MSGRITANGPTWRSHHRNKTYLTKKKVQALANKRHHKFGIWWPYGSQADCHVLIYATPIWLDNPLPEMNRLS